MDTTELRKLAEAAKAAIDDEPWWEEYTLSVNFNIYAPDAAFIAAASPDVVLGLLERLDRDCDTCANKSTDGIYSEDCLMCRHYFGDAYEPRPEENKCAPSQD